MLLIWKVHIYFKRISPQCERSQVFQGSYFRGVRKKIDLDYFKEAAGKDGLGDLTMELADFAFDDNSLPDSATIPIKVLFLSLVQLLIEA